MANQFGRTKKKEVEKVEVYSLLDPGANLERLNNIRGNAGTDVSTVSFRHMGKPSSITWEAPSLQLIRKHLDPAGAPPTVIATMAKHERLAREKRQRERERKEREERRHKREEQRKHGKDGRKGGKHNQGKKAEREPEAAALPSFAAYRQQQEKKQQLEDEKQEAKRLRKQRKEAGSASGPVVGLSAKEDIFSQSTPIGLKIGRGCQLQDIKDRFYNPSASSGTMPSTINSSSTMPALSREALQKSTHTSCLQSPPHYRAEDPSFRVGSASRAVIYYDGLPCPVPNGEPLSLATTDPYGFSLNGRPTLDLQVQYSSIHHAPSTIHYTLMAVPLWIYR
jgi:hypothetical protein